MSEDESDIYERSTMHASARASAHLPHLQQPLRSALRVHTPSPVPALYPEHILPSQSSNPLFRDRSGQHRGGVVFPQWDGPAGLERTGQQGGRWSSAGPHYAVYPSAVDASVGGPIGPRAVWHDDDQSRPSPPRSYTASGPSQRAGEGSVAGGGSAVVQGRSMSSPPDGAGNSSPRTSRDSLRVELIQAHLAAEQINLGAAALR